MSIPDSRNNGQDDGSFHTLVYGRIDRWPVCGYVSHSCNSHILVLYGDARASRQAETVHHGGATYSITKRETFGVIHFLEPFRDMILGYMIRV